MLCLFAKTIGSVVHCLFLPSQLYSHRLCDLISRSLIVLWLALGCCPFSTPDIHKSKLWKDCSHRPPYIYTYFGRLPWWEVLEVQSLSTLLGEKPVSPYQFSGNLWSSFWSNLELFCSQEKKIRVAALLVRQRIKVRARLFKQNVVKSDGCRFGCPTGREGESFGAFLSPFSHYPALFGYFYSWNQADWGSFYITQNESPNSETRPAWDSVLIAVLWNIWLAQSRKVFNNKNIPVQLVARFSSDTLKLWSARMNKSGKHSALSWIDSWPD